MRDGESGAWISYEVGTLVGLTIAFCVGERRPLRKREDFDLENAKEMGGVDLLMGKEEPSVGSEAVNLGAESVGPAPMKVIWARNWRSSTGADEGAALAKEARRAKAAEMANVFMLVVCRYF